MTDREAYVSFNLADSIGSVGVEELSSRHGGVAAAWEAFPGKVARSGGKVDAAAELEMARSCGVTVLTPADSGYPAHLRAVRGHPLALYVKGSVKALSMPSIAIVGTRRATAYGLDQAARFSRDIAQSGWCVVSGLALGIDAEAHKGALAAGGVTVGVLGSALDRFYPEENRGLARQMVESGGAVVSEFPFGREPDTQTFPQRNHVVAALASGVLAVEAPARSGTLITTDIAANIGRTVMAVPGRVDAPRSAGCLKLIRDGATLVRCAADVAEAMSELLPSAAARRPAPPLSVSRARAAEPAPPVTPDEAAVLRELDAGGVSVDRLVDITGLPAGKIGALCMSLRLKGLLRFLPGNRVAALRDL